MQIDNAEVGCLAVEGDEYWVLIDKRNTYSYEVYSIKLNRLSPYYYQIYGSSSRLEQNFYKQKLLSILYGIKFD